MSNKKPRIKTRSINETEWINNFWFIDDYLYLTDSHFDNPRPNMLGRIKVDFIVENLKNKNNFDRSFISHPNPVISNAVKASISDVELVNYYPGFVYNVIKFKDDLYISVIKNDHESFVIKISKDKEERINEYDNYLVIGELNEELVLKSVLTRETFINGIETKPRQIKRICSTEVNYIILTELNHLYSLKKGTSDLTTIKDNDNEINICNFDKSSYVISDKESKSTYLINKQGVREDIYQNYFYRLDCYNKILLIGKPLYMDDDLVESYTLPLLFVD